MEEELELMAKEIVITMYLTLSNYGYSEVSLKNEDLLEYIPKLENLLKKYHLFVSDLFVRTPVSETYDEYKNFLIEELYGKRLGFFNDKYNTIILECPKFYTYKCQKKLINYKEIIQEGCYLISNDIGFIYDDAGAELLNIAKSNHKEKTIKRRGNHYE